MTTTIRTREPRDLLALIPFQLGFRPTRSVVVVSLRGPRGRVGLVARVDLDDVTDPDAGPQVAGALVDHMVCDGARRVVVVVYADDDASDRADEVRSAWDAVAGPAGLAEPDCWVVAPSGWWGLGCDDVRCCPEGGRSHGELDYAPISAAMVLQGATVERDRAALGHVGEVTPAARRSARRAAERWSARREVLGGRLGDERWRADGLALWLDCLGRLEQEDGTVPSTAFGRLRAALDDVLVRDAALVSLVPDHGGQDDLPRRIAAQDATAAVDPALRALTDPGRGLAPGAARSAAATTLLRGVAAHAGPEGHAPSLTLLGVLAWWAGDGARAAVLLERALRARPGYRLARIVEEAVGRGQPPGWLNVAGGAPR